MHRRMQESHLHEGVRERGALMSWNGVEVCELCCRCMYCTRAAALDLNEITEVCWSGAGMMLLLRVLRLTRCSQGG